MVHCINKIFDTLLLPLSNIVKVSFYFTIFNRIKDRIDRLTNRLFSIKESSKLTIDNSSTEIFVSRLNRQRTKFVFVMVSSQVIKITNYTLTNKILMKGYFFNKDHIIIPKWGHDTFIPNIDHLHKSDVNFFNIIKRENCPHNGTLNLLRRSITHRCIDLFDFSQKLSNIKYIRYICVLHLVNIMGVIIIEKFFNLVVPKIYIRLEFCFTQTCYFIIFDFFVVVHNISSLKI